MKNLYVPYKKGYYIYLKPNQRYGAVFIMGKFKKFALFYSVEDAKEWLDRYIPLTLHQSNESNV